MKIKVKWIINDNPNSCLKYADITKLPETSWYTFQSFFKENFCCGSIDSAWEIFCLNKEVRLYKFR